MKIGSTCPRHQEFGLLYPNSMRLQGLLFQYHTVIVNLCKRAVLFIKKPFFSQLPSMLKASEFGRFSSDLERLATFIHEEVSLASKQLQNDEAEKILVFVRLLPNSSQRTCL